MKKQSSIFDLAKEIDQTLAKRETIIEQSAEELQMQKDQLAAQKSELEIAKASFEKEKAEFERIKGEVELKYSKIRSDAKLTEDLKAQAEQFKEILSLEKKNREHKAETQLLLEQIEKRELALSEREKTMQERVEREVLKNFLHR